MKKVIVMLSIMSLVFSALSCSTETVKLKPVVVYEYDGSGGNEDVIMENDFLEFRFVPETAEIILRDKSGGSEWRSTPVNAASDSAADPVIMMLMKSQFSLEYADETGVGMTLYSGANSVERSAYEYALVNGGLEVRYTVGNIARNYLLPPAAPEARMRTFIDKMEHDDRRKVEASYRLYDINNLRSGDNKNTLLENYPDLAETKVYVMRGNTPDYMKEQMEGFFADAGYTREDFYDDLARYTAASGTERPAFTVTLRYTLDGKSLVVTVPFDGIAYRRAFPITRLSLLPFMGAGGLDDEGYLLAPDGSGALIYFNNGKQNQLAYSSNVYGWDEAMPRDAVVSDNKAPYPVFGIQKNASALLCVIEEGAAYAAVRADVSGRNCSWNSIYARFDMIHGAKMDISGRSERAVYLYETGLPAGESITLRYTPCARDGYVGMAKEYRSYLQSRYPSLKGGGGGGIPLAVEIVGAVNKTQHRMGIPVDLPLKLTSYKEAENIVDTLARSGWKNVNVKLNGWFNHSVEHSIPTRVRLISELGSKKDFKNLVNTAGEYGYAVYPEADFFFMKDKKTFDGFSLYRDAARYVNRERIEKYPYSFVWFGERILWGKLSYLARPDAMMSMIDGFQDKASDYGLENIAFRSIGARLAGDYNEKRPISRQASLKLRQEKLAELGRENTGVLLHGGYVYAAPWASFITDLPLDDQYFGITDTPVPFYPIVLHGLVPYTGKAINLAEDYSKNLLKTIESGAGLYFSFMVEETAVLQETKFRQFYANEFHKWAADADELYRRFSTDFAGLYDQAIEDHIIVSPGVTVTEYENGVRVLVNAGNEAFTYNNITIEAGSYYVFR